MYIYIYKLLQLAVLIVTSCRQWSECSSYSSHSALDLFAVLCLLLGLHIDMLEFCSVHLKEHYSIMLSCFVVLVLLEFCTLATICDSNLWAQC